MRARISDQCFMAVTSHFRPRPARLPTTFEAFRNRGFRHLWPANFFSYVSRWMQMTLLVWLVLDLTGSPFRVALVGFFGMAPLLLFGAVGGVLVDRVDRRRLLIAMQVLNLTAGVAMVALLLSEMVQYWHAYVVVLASGLGWAFDMPSRRSLVLDLIGRANVTNAMALDSMGMHASRMAGPALAGGFIAAGGVTGGYYAIIALYSLSIAFLAPLRLPARTSVAASMSIARNLADGFAYVRTDRVILATVVITVLMNLLLFPYMQMVPVIARDTLGAGPGLMGILMGADGLGAIIGSVSIASARQIKYHGRVYLAGSLIALTMVLVFAASRWFAVSLSSSGTARTRNGRFRHNAVHDSGSRGKRGDEGPNVRRDFARDWSRANRRSDDWSGRRGDISGDRGHDLREPRTDHGQHGWLANGRDPRPGWSAI